MTALAVLKHYLVAMKQMLTNSAQQDQAAEERGEAQRAHTVGVVLRSARESRAMTLREVAERVHIPARYLTMLETNDYSAIADELYLLPFVRVYSEFLELDSGALSARFIHGIQRVDKFVELPPETDEPPAERLRSGWFTTAAVMMFVALAIYLVSLK